MSVHPRIRLGYYAPNTSEINETWGDSKASTTPMPAGKAAAYG
jgi:hypothetical protein